MTDGDMYLSTITDPTDGDYGVAAALDVAQDHKRQTSDITPATYGQLKMLRYLSANSSTARAMIEDYAKGCGRTLTTKRLPGGARKIERTTMTVTETRDLIGLILEVRPELAGVAA